MVVRKPDQLVHYCRPICILIRQAGFSACLLFFLSIDQLVMTVHWQFFSFSCLFFYSVLPRASVTSYATVTEGKDLNLTCHVTGSPPPWVEWTKVGDPAAVLSNTTVLTLRSVTRPGNANQTVQYRCTASNGYGEPDSAEVTVQVFCEWAPFHSAISAHPG